MLFFLSLFCNVLAVCFASWSCWKVNLLSQLEVLVFIEMISIHASIQLSINSTIVPYSKVEKHSHSSAASIYKHGVVQVMSGAWFPPNEMLQIKSKKIQSLVLSDQRSFFFFFLFLTVWESFMISFANPRWPFVFLLQTRGFCPATLPLDTFHFTSSHTSAFFHSLAIHYQYSARHSGESVCNFLQIKSVFISPTRRNFCCRSNRESTEAECRSTK